MSLLFASSELAEIAGEAAHEAEKARHSRRVAWPPDRETAAVDNGLDRDSFADRCPLALLDCASYLVLVQRLAVSLHATSPHSIALVQLPFTSFAVANVREDFHRQDRAHAGRATDQIVASHELSLFLSPHFHS